MRVVSEFFVARPMNVEIPDHAIPKVIARAKSRSRPITPVAIVTPTAPTAAFKIGEKADDPLAMYLADIYTVTADLVGVPGISVPCGDSKAGLPIGLQIFARHFDESAVFRLAHAYEKARA